MITLDSIPDLSIQKQSVINYKTVRINTGNIKYEEDYIDLLETDIKGENYYNTKRNPPYNCSIPGSISGLYVRKTVAEKLLKINNDLAELKLELFVFDCFRPFDVQNYLWHKWLPHYLREQNPNISKSELKKLRNEFTSKGPENDDEVDLKAPPPHSTGGAIDLTLRNVETLELLNMGTIFDDFTELSYTDYYESKRKNETLNNTENEALLNRRVLFNIMQKHDFRNYPYEWWHFSWGDQMWAILSGSNEAFYSYKKPVF